MNNNELKEKVTEMVLADPNMLESLKALYEELSHVEPAKEQKPDMMYVLTQKIKVATDTEEEIYHYHPLVGECLLIPGAEKNQMICSANLLELQNVQHSPMLTGFGVQQGSLQILALKPDDFELLQLLLDETITAIIDNTHKAVEVLLQNDAYTSTAAICFEKIYENIMRDLMGKSHGNIGAALNADSGIVEKIDNVRYDYQSDYDYEYDYDDEEDEPEDEEDDGPPHEDVFIIRRVN